MSNFDEIPAEEWLARGYGEPLCECKTRGFEKCCCWNTEYKPQDKVKTLQCLCLPQPCQKDHQKEIDEAWEAKEGREQVLVLKERARCARIVKQYGLDNLDHLVCSAKILNLINNLQDD